MKASNIAGKAINISRTTAAHALSYKITSEYGIPHGHAVALAIPKLCEINTANNEFKEILDIVTNNATDYFEKLYNLIGLNNNLCALGITDIKSIIASVNYERLNNNPIKLSYLDLKNILN